MASQKGDRPMQTIQEYIPVTKAKNEFLDLIRKIGDSDDAIAITKNGIPEAVLISMKKFKSLLETVDILLDEKAMQSIRNSIKQAKSGKWVDFSKVFSE
jgi:antitoxin YefM